MKTWKRMVAAMLCAMVCISLCPAVAEGAKEIHTSLAVTDITLPTLANQGVDNAYRHNGTGNKAVYYYGYLRKPVALTGEPFAECFPYMCYGTGSRITELNHNMLSFNFDAPSTPVAANDVVYVSFYYRSASTFTGMDGKTYTGKTQTPAIRLNSKEIAMYELSSGSRTVSAFEADGQWHKVEYYLPITNGLYEKEFGGGINMLQLRISFLDLDLAAYIELTGMRYGVMKTDSAEITNRAAYTYLGWNLCKGDLSALTVDGEAVLLKNGMSEYTVRAGSTTPDIQAVQPAGVSKDPVVSEHGILEYEIKAYARGYDSCLPDDAERGYVRSVDETGEFSETGTEEGYFIRNDAHYSVIRLHLNVKFADAALTLNGAVYDGSAPLKSGDSFSIEETFQNIRGVDTNYMTLLVFRKEGTIVEMIPYMTVVGAAEPSVTANHTYILPVQDYGGQSAELFIIDTNTMADVLR